VERRCTVVVAERRVEGDILQAQAARVVSGLADHGVGQGDTVALLMRTDLALLEATIAVSHLGAYPVQINWHGSADEITYVLADCRPRVLIAHSDLLRPLDLGSFPELAVIEVPTPPEVAVAYRVPADRCAPHPGSVVWDDWLMEYEPSDRPPIPSGESIIYTSGTSGKPKGVRRFAPTPEQASLSDDMRRLVFGVDRGARVLVSAPLYHISPNIFALRGLRLGELLVLPARFDAEGLLRDIERHRITHLYTVATMFIRLLRLPPETRALYDTSPLSLVLHGAGPCPTAVKRSMIDWWGPILQEYYGATEPGPMTYCTSAEWLERPGTVGRAVPGVHLEILDEAGTILPPGQMGEICAYNPGYPDFTYLNREEARAALQRGPLLATGDIGYFDAEGYLFVCDRKRDLVISGGVNIYPKEIESVLIELEGVADCAVFGIPHDEFGEELMAVVQTLDGHDLSADRIKAFLGTRLPGYKVPRAIEFRRALPREESGKIKKRLLRDPYWAGKGRTI
jgi:long-chain acyl-CoA synthetase